MWHPVNNHRTEHETKMKGWLVMHPPSSLSQNLRIYSHTGRANLASLMGGGNSKACKTGLTLPLPDLHAGDTVTQATFDLIST